MKLRYFSMVAKMSIIKLKPQDIKRTTIRGLKQAAWESKQTGRSLSEQIHRNPKHKKPKHKKGHMELLEEFKD